MQKVDYSYIINTKKLKDIEYIGIESVRDKKNNSIRKFKFYCKTHGYFYLSIDNVKKQSEISCTQCRRDERWSFDIVKNKIFEVTPEYILKEIKPNKRGICILTLSCGKHDFYDVAYDDFFNKNYRCRNCYYENNNQQPWTKEKCLETFSNYGFKLLNIDTIEESFSYKQKFVLLDKEGFKYYLSIANILKSNSSDNIGSRNPFSFENAKLWTKLYRNDYEILSKNMKNTDSILKFYYKGDFLNIRAEDRIFEKSWSHFKQGGMHPLSKISYGEERVYTYLKHNNINFDFQKSFKDCYNPITKRLFYYDFMINDENNKPILNIEYDSEIHETPIDYFGGIDNYEDTVYRDKFKEIYLIVKKIHFIKIKPKDLKNLNEILTTELKNRNII